MPECVWKLADGKTACGQSTLRGEALVCEPLINRDDLCDLHRFALRREREERAQVALDRIRKLDILGSDSLEGVFEIITEICDWAAATEKTATGKAAATSVTAEGQ